jgi:hypothetical protein
MRTIKELLQIMLDNQDLFQRGLCGWACRIYEHDIINNEELSELEDYIIDNRPSKYSSISAFLCQNSLFYWTHGNISPRIKWIKKHIKLNS